MKKIIMVYILFSSLNALATSSPRIICHDDQRLNNGPLREIIVTSDESGYFLQSSYVASLSAPSMQVERWAEGLSCRFDEKLSITYCQNSTGQNIVQIKERREVFYDSLEEDTKKKTTRYIDISVQENGVGKKAQSFAASHCQLLSGESLT